jgi:hypothetical protein
MTIERWGLVLTVVIAFAAVVQALTAIWQARVYERQYKIMSDALIASNQSADAALKGVIALEKLERPFLMIELRGQLKVKTQVWIVNKGKIPAQILWHNPDGILIFQTREEIEKLPRNYPYAFGYDDTRHEGSNDPWLAPGEEMQLTYFNWTKAIGSLDAETIRQYQVGDKLALFLSAVKYRGMLTETIFETRWCFRWFGPDQELKLYGPAGYNKYT